jgi:p38 MAP kinase
LNRILEVVGYPSDSLLQQINEDARNYLERTPLRPQRVDFHAYFANEIQSPLGSYFKYLSNNLNIILINFFLINSKKAIDLISKMLQLDPSERVSCEQALEHPYLKLFHDPEDEPEGTNFDDNYEEQDLTILEWKSKIISD